MSTSYTQESDSRKIRSLTHRNVCNNARNVSLTPHKTTYPPEVYA